MEARPINPAKVFLRRYRDILRRQESLIRSLQAIKDRQTNCTVKLNAVQVQSGGFVRDRMAEEIISGMELEDQILEAEKKAAAELKEILRAIEAVQDEALKTVLVLRYIEGLYWSDIAEKMHFEISNVYIMHGRALWTVNKSLQEKALANPVI